MIAARALALIVAVSELGGCGRLVGIHGPRDAAAGDGAAGLADGAGAADLALGDAKTSAPDAGVETAPREAGSDGGGRVDLGDGSSAADGGDANRCGNLWHATSAQAGVYSIAASATTACGYAAAALPTLAAAFNATDFRGALACGSCLRVQPTFGSASVVVQVVDLGGASGLLLSQPALNAIATPGTSSLTVDWQLVACDTQGQTLSYLAKDGTNSNYVGIQVRHQRYPVVSVTALGNGGQMLPFTLQVYNYWESTVPGVGATSLTLRLTDINGQTVEDTGVGVVPLVETTGRTQFPVCE